MPNSRDRKEAYFERLESCLEQYARLFLVCVDNVQSNQMQQIRAALRGKAEVVMGKNTMIRKVFNNFIKKNVGHPIESLLPYIKGNVGFVFTNGDLDECREAIHSNRVAAPARVGAVAPCDVYCPAGPTGCDPGQTSFFQALQVATKIVKGQVEIVSDVLLTKEGEKVGNSEATLLKKLGIKPFSYGVVINMVYDNGSLFSPQVLDLTEEDLCAKFMAGVRNVAAVCLEVGYPTLASLPHSIANAFKMLVAVAVECEGFSFAKADRYKAFLADPSAFAAPAAADGNDADTAPDAKEEEEEEDVDFGGGMDMFGDGEDY